MSNAVPHTKIVATLGPATAHRDGIRRLVESGVSIFRINFSHGDTVSHAKAVRVVREVTWGLGSTAAILGDLPGPKIRLGEVVDGGVLVPDGAEVILQREPIQATDTGSPYRFSSPYPTLIDDVRTGQRVLINDGAVRMLVMDRTDDELHCAVTTGGLITTAKGINLPDSDPSTTVLSERDRRLAAWAVDQDLDFLGLSFVGRAADIVELRDIIAAHAARRGRDCAIEIVAKIERPRAVENIESITAVADAIMVARGDLGVEMDLAHVPVIQKQIIRCARRHGTPCIVATQMLETMIERPQPTRAEASDVANAIFDGIDAVMLSGETAVGKYPDRAVRVMARIARHTEQHREPLPPPAVLAVPAEPDQLRALAHGVWHIARDWAARFIVVWSQSGISARALSRHDFGVEVVAMSSDPQSVRRMSLLRGVRPVRMPVPSSLGDFTRMVDARLLETGRARMGERGILVAGWPIGPDMVTNNVAIHRIGDRESGYAFHA